jgi:uncharacterized membrane protein
MSLARQLARWQAASLIDGQTAEWILAFEHGRRRPVLLYAFGGLGALAVATGILSVIAANWEHLGRHAKLGADLILLGGVACGAYRSRPAHWLREVSLLLYFLLVLASIALVGQTYQLGGEAHEALALWLLLGSPMVLFGRSWMLAASWLAALVASVATAIAKASAVCEWLSGDAAQVTVTLAALSLGPLLCLSLGTAVAVTRRRPHFASFFRAVGWFWLVGLTSLAQHLWYTESSGHRVRGLFGMTPLPLQALIAPVAAGLALAWYLPRTLPGASGRGRQLARAVLLFATLSSALPAVIEHDEIPVAGAISFFLLWVGFALTAYQLGRIRLLNLATGVLALRLVVAYVELFGSLLQTGLGMILGGLLTLALAWGWVRKSRDFRKDNAGQQETEA